MATERRCKHCRRRFVPRPQNPDQKYHSEPACQKARKREWQKRKLENDPDYQDNQQDAQRRWRENNPDYQREYRQRNKEYTERNRWQQQARNRLVRGQNDNQPVIAKMDASPAKYSVLSGRYELRRIESGDIVKMDASIVEINVISAGYP